MHNRVLLLVSDIRDFSHIEHYFTSLHAFTFSLEPQRVFCLDPLVNLVLGGMIRLLCYEVGILTDSIPGYLVRARVLSCQHALCEFVEVIKGLGLPLIPSLVLFRDQSLLPFFAVSDCLVAIMAVELPMVPLRDFLLYKVTANYLIPRGLDTLNFLSEQRAERSL